MLGSFGALTEFQKFDIFNIGEISDFDSKAYKILTALKNFLDSIAVNTADFELQSLLKELCSFIMEFNIYFKRTEAAAENAITLSSSYEELNRTYETILPNGKLYRVYFKFNQANGNVLNIRFSNDIKFDLRFIDTEELDNGHEFDRSNKDLCLGNILIDGVCYVLFLSNVSYY